MEVVNLGEDQEVRDMKDNLNLAEKRLHHTMATPPSEQAPINMAQDLGVDEDIAMAQHNIALAEGKH